jgi:glycosyltransferase involved in cell wall biosynthesis
MFPFELSGDARVDPRSGTLISCVIPTRNRPFELDRILSSLAMQDVERGDLEVIIIEDGVSKETRDIVRKHSAAIPVQYEGTERSLHSLGMLRNRGLELATGRYILFLDDDSLILQENFLSILCERFRQKPDIDCILIAGHGDRCLLPDKYSYFNTYSFGGACIAYSRRSLVRMKGFYNDMATFEDIELSLRYLAGGGNVHRDEDLVYFHPPSYFTSWDKPIKNGASFAKARKRYSFLFWLVCYMGTLRFLPLLALSPFSKKYRQWAMISVGFLIGPCFDKWRSASKKHHQ